MRLVVDGDARVYANGRVLVAAGRILRLTDAGPAALRALLEDRASPVQRRLGQRLIEAGIAHPSPELRRVAVTTVIPVRDRPTALARCLAASEGSVVVVDDGSHDPEATAAVCRRHGATCVRREVSGGPGAARNDGVMLADTELVAFVDSDCIPPPGWTERLAGHFDDPRVAVVAPRVKALGGGRSPLDMGDRPAEVQPGRRVSYVPSAALLVRRAALPQHPFDPALRYGEDVDLIWRLIDAGWRVRYEPGVVVHHEEHATFTRRFRYGTSAAPLAQRHPDRLAHVILRPWPTLTLALLLVRRPRLAALAYGLHTARLGRLLRSHGVPARLAPLWTARALTETVTQFAVLATPYGAGVLYGHLAARLSRSRRTSGSTRS